MTAEERMFGFRSWSDEFVRKRLHGKLRRTGNPGSDQKRHRTRHRGCSHPQLRGRLGRRSLRDYPIPRMGDHRTILDLMPDKEGE